MPQKYRWLSLVIAGLLLLLPNQSMAEASPSDLTRIIQAQTSISLDVTQDGEVTPLDTLTIINYTNSNGTGAVSSDSEHLDVNKDGMVTPLDVLNVVNYLNKPHSIEPLELQLTGPEVACSEASFSWSTVDSNQTLTTYRWRLQKPDGSFTDWVKQTENQLSLDNKISTQGQYVLELQAQYSRGYWSGILRHGFSIDCTPPTGSTNIKGDKLYTTISTVDLELSAPGAESGQMMFSFDNRNWQNPEPYSSTKTLTLPSNDGLKYVYVKFSDTAGNWSISYSDTITLDTTKPETTDLGIDNQWHEQVTVTLNASDSSSGVAHTYYTIDGSIPTTLSTEYTAPFTISAEGRHAIRYFSVDRAGNSELPKQAINTVKIDKTSPSGTIVVNNDDPYTDDPRIDLQLSAHDSGSQISQMMFSFNNRDWNPPEPYSETKTLTLPGDDGEKFVYVKFSDFLGNWSQSFSDDINLDTTEPDIIITYPEDGAIVNTDDITIIGTVDGQRFEETRPLPVANGPNPLVKRHRDNAGNENEETVTVYRYPGTVIGPAGGEIISPDGKVRVLIPGQALNSSIEISLITSLEDNLQGSTPQGKSLLQAAEFRAYDAQTNQYLPDLEFLSDIRVVYTLDEPEVPGTELELGLYNPDTQKIESLEPRQVSLVSSSGDKVEFTLKHFSTYAALKGMFSENGAPIGSGVDIPLPDMFTGAFGHSISLTIPPGRKKMQPNLGLNYRSSNPNSWVGVGFSLNPGYIVRSTRLGPPTYNDQQDTFYFINDAGSTELVHLTDNLYQAKIESAFTKFYKQADDTWKVVEKNGMSLYFGETSSSKETASLGTFSWYLTKALDTNSNSVEYQYTKDQGKVYLDYIDYTGNQRLSLSGPNRVEFYLESRRDEISSYISGSQISTAKRLSEIKVKQNSDLVWSYDLEYDYSPDTERSLLKSVTQIGADGTALPKQQFSYQSN